MNVLQPAKSRIQQHTTPSADLRIDLDTTNFVFHGSASESAGAVLSGTVSLVCHEIIKIKSLTLKFWGKMKVQWTDVIGSNARVQKDEKTIIEHEWVFLAPGKKNHSLPPGHYKYSFQLPLPGNLPQSIPASEFGEIFYRLRALAERTTLSVNLNAKEDIQITRTMSPSAPEFSQSMNISNVWARKLLYDISVSAKAFGDGDRIPATFTLQPLASDLKIRYLTCALKEYATFTTSAGATRHESRIVRYLRDEQFPSNGPVWQKTETIVVPRIPTTILADTHTPLIRIKHKLKFTISLINGDGNISELRAAVPLIISAIGQVGEGNSLPPYEEAVLQSPYVPRTESDPITSHVAMNDFAASLEELGPVYRSHGDWGIAWTSEGESSPGVSPLPSPTGDIQASQAPVNGQDTLRPPNRRQHSAGFGIIGTRAGRAQQTVDAILRRSSFPSLSAAGSEVAQMSHSQSATNFNRPFRQPPLPSSQSPPHAEDQGTEPHTHDVTDLGRVPSYRSVASRPQQDYFEAVRGLPSYESTSG